MFKEKTLFVLGAGSSLEYGYPDSENLTNLICERTLPVYSHRDLIGIENLNKRKIYCRPNSNPIGDQEKNFNYFYTELRHLFNKSTLEEFSSALSYSTAPSIDEFLSIKANYEFAILGKCAIIQTILYCENKEEKFKGWYEKLYHKFWPDLEKDFDFSNVSFLTFNYDRSFEQSLFTKIHQFYRNDFRKATATFKNLNIHHVYGSVSEIIESTQHLMTSELLFKYGEFPNLTLKHNPSYVTDMWNYLCGRIRTFHEGEDFENEKITSMINDSQVIVFLGFGFHNKNLSYFKDFTGHVRATSYGLKDRQIRNARLCFGNRIKFHPMKISEFADIDFDLPSIWGE